MSAPNAELAYRVLDLALAHESHFDMSLWAERADWEPVTLDALTGSACGTTACLAGWTVAMAGYAVNYRADVFDSDGNPLGRKADSVAAEMFRITLAEAERLFYASNESVENRIAEIFGPRPGGDS